MKRRFIAALAIGLLFSAFLTTITAILDYDSAWMDWQMPGLTAAYLFWGVTGGSTGMGIFVCWLVNGLVYGGGLFAVSIVVTILNDAIRRTEAMVGRAAFWRLNGFCALSLLAAYLLIDVRVHPNWATSTKTAIGYVLFFVTCLAMMIVGLRRLHERGRSFLWACLYYPALVLVTTGNYDGNGKAVIAIGWIIVVGAAVDLGLLSGKQRRPIIV